MAQHQVIYETQEEYEARIANKCPACNQNKEQGSLVCWDCFKRRDDIIPLKFYQGTFNQWLILAKTK